MRGLLIAGLEGVVWREGIGAEAWAIAIDRRTKGCRTISGIEKGLDDIPQVPLRDSDRYTIFPKEPLSAKRPSSALTDMLS